MILALDPGTQAAGEVRRRAGACRSGNTLPDVNPDEVLGALDGDTRAYLRILLNAGGSAFRDDGARGGRAARSQDLRETFKRFEPTARDSSEHHRAADRAPRATSSARSTTSSSCSTALGGKDKQLAALVDSANANFEAFAEEEASLREALRLLPRRALADARRRCTDVDALAAELGPDARGRCARSRASWRRRCAPARPFLRDDHADHPGPDPPVRPRRPAHRARPARRHGGAGSGHARG